MKKHLITVALTAPLALSALAGNPVSANAIDDLESLSHAVEVSRLCDTLLKAGGSDPRCARVNTKPTPEAQGPSQGVQQSMPQETGRTAPAGGKKASSPPPTPPLEVDIVAYVQNADKVYLEVLVEKQYRRIRVGDRVKMWQLTGVSDYDATFTDVTGRAEPVSIAFRTPPAAPSPQPSVAPGSAPGMAAGAPLPGGMPPLPGAVR